MISPKKTDVYTISKACLELRVRNYYYRDQDRSTVAKV
jgi:hypothetical protein